jgi:hypothetical protein
VTHESAQGCDRITSATTEGTRKSFRNHVGFGVESNAGDAAEVRLACIRCFRDVTHLRLHDRRIYSLRWTLKTTFLVGEGPGSRRVGNTIWIFGVGGTRRGRIFEKSEVDRPCGAKRIGDKVIPGSDRIGNGMNANCMGEIVATACGDDEKRTRRFCQRTQDAMNASISSDNDDGVREIAALNLVSAKDIDSYSLKWVETGIGFVRMEDGSDAHNYFRIFEFTNFRI